MGIKRLAIIEHDTLLRSLLVSTLESNTDIEVVYQSGSGLDFLEHIGHLGVHAVIVSSEPTDIPGVELIYRVSFLHDACVIIGLNHAGEAATASMMYEAGVSSVINCVGDLEGLHRVIRCVEDIEVPSLPCDRGSSQSGTEAPADSSEGLLIGKEASNDIFSRRERRILELLLKGYTSDEIGKCLHIARSTVDTHRRRMRMKTGSKNTAALISYAIRNSLS